jgi:NifU-like protein involved in Fe-S cluster formation
MAMAMSEPDLVTLYSKRILALASDIPHLGRLTAPEASAKRRSPLCGSTVTVDLTTKDGRITDFAQDVKACALGQASAAVLGDVVIGRNKAELTRARDELKAMLQSGGAVPAAPFDGYDVLQAAKDYRNRHASILLALDATIEAMDQIAG